MRSFFLNFRSSVAIAGDLLDEDRWSTISYDSLILIHVLHLQFEQLPFSVVKGVG